MIWAISFTVAAALWLLCSFIDTDVTIRNIDLFASLAFVGVGGIFVRLHQIEQTIKKGD